MDILNQRIRNSTIDEFIFVSEFPKIVLQSVPAIRERLPFVILLVDVFLSNYRVLRLVSIAAGMIN